MNPWQYLLVNSPEGEIGAESAVPAPAPSTQKAPDRQAQMAAAIDLMRRNQGALQRVKAAEAIRSLEDLRRRAQEADLERRVDDRLNERKRIRSEEM